MWLLLMAATSGPSAPFCLAVNPGVYFLFFHSPFSLVKDIISGLFTEKLLPSTLTVTLLPGLNIGCPLSLSVKASRSVDETSIVF